MGIVINIKKKEQKEESSYDFSAIMEKNRKNKERIDKERQRSSKPFSFKKKN